ncbi:MAG TPA: hypothetical protein VF940_27330 [Streptosporangiaceae bacterium]
MAVAVMVWLVGLGDAEISPAMAACCPARRRRGLRLDASGRRRSSGASADHPEQAIGAVDLADAY